jgi:hypothetical protein
MHAVKVALLLVLTLAVMRSGSWIVGWLMCRALRKTSFWSSLASNLICLTVFAGLLFWNLMPGEGFDYAALAFGAVVYTLCLVMDLRWRPWPSPGASPSMIP